MSHLATSTAGHGGRRDRWEGLLKPFQKVTCGKGEACTVLLRERITEGSQIRPRNGIPVVPNTSTDASDEARLNRYVVTLGAG